MEDVGLRENGVRIEMQNDGSDSFYKIHFIFRRLPRNDIKARLSIFPK